jgi:putative salt-induced outer membrane protein YdiY
MHSTESVAVLSVGGLGLAGFLCLAAAPAFAEDKPAGKKGWETSAFLGATLTRGNSETFLGNLTLDTERKWPSDEVAFGASAGYGEATVDGNHQKNTEYLRAHGQYDRLLTERFYAGVRADGEYDGIAGVDYRARLSPLAGYYFVKKPKTTLRGELGPSVVFEKLENQPPETFASFRAAERFEHKLTETTRIWQTFEYSPRVDRWSEKYLFIGEVGIDAAVTRKASLSLVLQDNFDSEPATGRKQNDVRLIAGLRYRF